ncbi:MAG: helix-turn-helix transcriptional regulator [Thermoflexibacter sp.]|jgi:transcriptional regulator with XRE-family HTH domain|nr:helix-turn-helix transcriptional regulator [Thermoflexibacter sp.]
MDKQDIAFSNVLKKLRKQKNISQAQLAFEAGLHRTYISQLERGIKNPTLKTIYKLCDVLEIDMIEMIRLIEHEIKAL